MGAETRGVHPRPTAKNANDRVLRAPADCSTASSPPLSILTFPRRTNERHDLATRSTSHPTWVPGSETTLYEGSEAVAPRSSLGAVLSSPAVDNLNLYHRSRIGNEHSFYHRWACRARAGGSFPTGRQENKSGTCWERPQQGQLAAADLQTRFSVNIFTVEPDRSGHQAIVRIRKFDG